MPIVPIFGPPDPKSEKAIGTADATNLFPSTDSQGTIWWRVRPGMAAVEVVGNRCSGGTEICNWGYDANHWQFNAHLTPANQFTISDCSLHGDELEWIEGDTSYWNDRTNRAYVSGMSGNITLCIEYYVSYEQSGLELVIESHENMSDPYGDVTIFYEMLFSGGIKRAYVNINVDPDLYIYVGVRFLGSASYPDTGTADFSAWIIERDWVTAGESEGITHL